MEEKPPHSSPGPGYEKYQGGKNTCNCPPHAPNREIPTLAEEAELGGFGVCAVLLLSAVIYQ